MRKNVFVFIVLMSYPVLAQISSGTIIIFDFTKDELVVAADSRALDDRTSAAADSYCKIAAFHHEFVFTTVGKARYTKIDPGDPIDSWHNVTVAGDALHDAIKGMTIDDAYMEAAVTYWADIIESHWNRFCLANRGRCVTNTGPLGIPLQAQKTELTAGVFVGATGLLVRAASIDSDSDMTKFLNPVSHLISSTLAQCWACGEGEQICAAGSHVDVAAQFCPERRPDSKLSVRTVLTRADQHTKLAVAIVEKTIDTYEKSAGDVGGEVDSVTITKNGKISWNSRKKNCPENQD